MQLLVLSISRDILKAGSRDRVRMHLYAKELEEMHVIVFTRKSYKLPHETIHEGNLHLYPTNSHTRLSMLFDAYILGRRLLRERRMNITSQDPMELGFLAYVLSRKQKAHFSVQVHGDYLGGEWVKSSPLQHFRLGLLKWVLKHAHSIRVVSLRIERSLKSIGIQEDRIRILPIRPELEKFIATPRTEKNDAFVILTASRFTTEKNLTRLIRSFAALRADCPTAVLRIVGRGPLEASLRALVSSLGIERNVTFVPWTESIEEEMAGAHVFALASLHEAYGLVLIEALATGTPVVTTDVGCVGEVVIDGVHGVVVNEDGDNAYTEALKRMYLDDTFRRKAGEAGKLLGKKLSEVSSKEYAEKWVAAHTTR